MLALKRFFPVPFVAILFICSTYSLYQLWHSAGALAWLGASLAVLPMTLIFTFIMLGRSARLPKQIRLHFIFSIIALALMFMDFQVTAASIVALGITLNLLYEFWYVPLPRQTQIQVGQPLPLASFIDMQGNSVSTTNQGRPQVWMFTRGNWCPFCVAQAKELANEYAELEKFGAEVFYVSAQSVEESQKLAQRFAVPIQFLIDPDTQGAKALGIQHSNGTPVGLPGNYDTDTIMPTIIITNAEGTVIFADQTDDYRLRPEPQLFSQILAQYA